MGSNSTLLIKVVRMPSRFRNRRARCKSVCIHVQTMRNEFSLAKLLGKMSKKEFPIFPIFTNRNRSPNQKNSTNLRVLQYPHRITHMNGRKMMVPRSSVSPRALRCGPVSCAVRLGDADLLFFHHWPYLQRLQLTISQDLDRIRSVGW